jgi:hypothetical protein
MPSAVLDVDFACTQRRLDAVVYFEDDLAGYHDLHVDRVGGVHAGLVELVGFQDAGELLLELAQTGLDVDAFKVGAAVAGREGQDKEAVSADGSSVSARYFGTWKVGSALSRC